MSLSTIVKEYKALSEKIKTELVNAIEEIPQNKNITPLGNRCFSVSFSEILNNNGIISPDYYDFEVQKEFLIEILESDKRGFEKKIEILKEIAEKGKILSRGQHTIRFHPEVLTKIKEILKDLEEIENE